MKFIQNIIFILLDYHHSNLRTMLLRGLRMLIRTTLTTTTTILLLLRHKLSKTLTINRSLMLPLHTLLRLYTTVHTF